MRNITLGTRTGPATLCTLAEAKERLGISGAAEDTLISGFIAAALAQFEAYTDNILSARPVTELVIGESGPYLILSYHNVVSLTSVSFDDVAEVVGDYEVLNVPGIVRRKDNSSMDSERIQAVYVAGLAATTDVLREATLLFVRDLYNARAKVSGIKRESVPDVADVTYTTGDDDRVAGANGVMMSTEIASLLAPYRRTWAP